MNQEIKAKWVNALRSGDYKQGTGFLARKNEGTTYYCCLGVLCEILGIPKKEDRTGSSGIILSFDGAIGTLPEVVVNKAGITPSGLLPPNHLGSLVKVNDSGASFLEIADIIEKEL